MHKRVESSFRCDSRASAGEFQIGTEWFDSITVRFVVEFGYFAWWHTKSTRLRLDQLVINSLFSVAWPVHCTRWHWQNHQSNRSLNNVAENFIRTKYSGFYRLFFLIINVVVSISFIQICVCLQLPMVLSTLQRSIYAVALGKPTKPDFFSNGVPKNSLIEEVNNYYLKMRKK